ncbi:thiamine pyrophosphate-binding protein [Microlunatus soli]|uniref:Acetolactate synthase large subunit n=1 Tax=Microlunatus soli TaxID=630515 RepID=A0A1H1ZAP3_9ACTN|nr:thiamine pyrophosphate-binding protein [Microlunatus soli]SDT30841.1 Acetolactate synthase large subunit [Microlunatus soli]
MPTVSATVARTLTPYLSHCFGVMGNGNAYLLDALADTDIGYVPVRHEVAGVVAADAYYRASARIAAATATYGPGFTNTLTALAEAVQAHTPLLLIVGDRPSSGPRPWDVDQPGLAAAVGAATFTVDADDPGRITIAALQHALDERTAVVLAIPYDLAAAPVAATTPPTLISRQPPAPDARSVTSLQRLLSRAERPLLLAGRGAWLSDAGEALTELAHRIGALTATSAGGVGIFDTTPDGRDADLGICGGFADDDAAKLINAADLVLVAGAGLNPFTMRHQTAFAEDATVVQIDCAPTATHERVDHFLHGDVRTTVEALLPHLDPASARQWRQQAANRGDHRHPGTGLAPDGLLDPRTVAHRLNGVLPADRTVVSDGGHFIGWAPTYWDIPSPNRLIMVGTQFQSIGLGLPSAVGAGAALSDSTIVLTTGDGGGLMGAADLETMIRTVRRGVVVVWNDGYYGAELHQYGSKGLHTEPMRIPTVDFAGVGRALGAEAAVIAVPDDLDRLQQWLDSGVDGVFVADCRISAQIRAPYMQTQLSITARSGR